MILNTRVLRAMVAAAAAWIALPSGADTGGAPTFGVASDPNFVLAKEAIEVKNWNKAIYHLKYVKSDSVDVYNLLGYANRHLGNFDEAFKNYKIALQADPNHRGVHEYVGEAYLMTNNLAMAEQHLGALERICGKGCEEYKDLAREIAEYKKKK
jgi:tetratricopeptide (TPR) repeat protein